MVSSIYYLGKIKISNTIFARAITTYDAVTQAFGVCVKFVERNHFYSECCSHKWACRFLLCVKDFVLNSVNHRIIIKGEHLFKKIISVCKWANQMRLAECRGITWDLELCSVLLHFDWWEGCCSSGRIIKYLLKTCNTLKMEFHRWVLKSVFKLWLTGIADGS